MLLLLMELSTKCPQEDIAYWPFSAETRQLASLFHVKRLAQNINCPGMTPMALGNVSRSLPLEWRTCQQSEEEG